MPDIMHLVKIRTAPERVYQAITTAARIGNLGTRDTVLESKIGGTGEFGFYERRVLTTVRIDELASLGKYAFIARAISRCCRCHR
jgi:hypothetical protein